MGQKELVVVASNGLKFWGNWRLMYHIVCYSISLDRFSFVEHRRNTGFIRVEGYLAEKECILEPKNLSIGHANDEHACFTMDRVFVFIEILPRY